jgi:hypothetical protein
MSQGPLCQCGLYIRPKGYTAHKKGYLHKLLMDHIASVTNDSIVCNSCQFTISVNDDKLALFNHYYGTPDVKCKKAFICIL